MNVASIRSELTSLRRRVEQLEKATTSPLGCLPTGISVQDIIKATAIEFEVAPEAILSARRNREFCIARQVAMMLTIDLLNLSTVTTGRRFSRDHSTVLYAHRYMAERCRNEPQLAMRVQRVRLALLNTNQGATA